MAAEQFCDHWETRLRLFGEEKAFLPLSLTEALKDDYQSMLQMNCIPFLGMEDTFGRAVIYVTSPPYCALDDEQLRFVSFRMPK